MNTPHGCPATPSGKVIDMDVRKYLKGTNFPADRNEIETAAKRNNAPQDVIQGFRRLPQREFRNEDEVTQALESKQTSPQTP